MVYDSHDFLINSYKGELYKLLGKNNVKIIILRNQINSNTVINSKIKNIVIESQKLYKVLYNKIFI